MKLCIGTYLTLLERCKKKDSLKRTLTEDMLSTLLDGFSELDDAPATKIRHCIDKMTGCCDSAINNINKFGWAEIQDRIWLTVCKHLDSEETAVFLYALADIVSGICPDKIFTLGSKKALSFNQLDYRRDPAEYVSCLFAYAVIHTKNDASKEELDQINDAYLEKFKRPLTIIDEAPVGLAENYSQTPIRTYQHDKSRQCSFEKLKKQLKEGKIIFVTGDPGIGKSEFVLYCLKVLADGEGYQTFQTDFKGSLLDTVLLLNFNTSTSCKKSVDYTSDSELKAAYRLQMNHLHAQGSNVILLIDNFDAADGKTYDLLLKDSEESPIFRELCSLKMHIVFTTRYRDFFDEDPIIIDRLPCEHLRSVILSYPRSQDYSHSDLQTLDSIIEVVDRHTLTVDLIGRTLSCTYALTPQQLLEALKNGDLAHKFWKVRTGYRTNREKKTILDHLKIVFSLAGLCDIHKYILSNMVMVPYDGIGKEDLVDKLVQANLIEEKGIITELDKHELLSMSFEDDLDKLHEIHKNYIDELINSGWLNFKGGNIYMHSLVKIVCENSADTKTTWEKDGGFLTAICLSVQKLIDQGFQTKEERSLCRIYHEMLTSAIVKIMPLTVTTYSDLIQGYPGLGDILAPYDGVKGVLVVSDKAQLRHLLESAAKSSYEFGQFSQSNLLWHYIIEYIKSTMPGDKLTIGHAYSRIAEYHQSRRDFQKTEKYRLEAIKNYEGLINQWKYLAHERYKLGQLYLEYSLNEKATEQFALITELLELHSAEKQNE